MVIAGKNAGRARACRAFTEMRFGASRVLFSHKETALLHANFAMDSIPHSLQMSLLVAGGILGLYLAISFVRVFSTEEQAPLSGDVQTSENGVSSGMHVPAEHGAPGRRF